MSARCRWTSNEKSSLNKSLIEFFTSLYVFPPTPLDLKRSFAVYKLINIKHNSLNHLRPIAGKDPTIIISAPAHRPARSAAIHPAKPLRKVNSTHHKSGDWSLSIFIKITFAFTDDEEHSQGINQLTDNSSPSQYTSTIVAGNHSPDSQHNQQHHQLQLQPQHHQIHQSHHSLQHQHQSALPVSHHHLTPSHQQSPYGTETSNFGPFYHHHHHHHGHMSGYSSPYDKFKIPTNAHTRSSPSGTTTASVSSPYHPGAYHQGFYGTHQLGRTNGYIDLVPR